MNVFSSHLLRTILFVSALAVATSACGRRGALESPPDPKAAASQKDKSASNVNNTNDDESDNDLSAPVGQAKKRPKGFVIPKEPFILDPLL